MKAVGGWKVCPTCGERKPVSEFSRDSSRVDGYVYQCKICCRAYRRGDRQRSPQQSERARAVDRVAHRRYYQTEKGRASLARAARSEKGKVAHRRYDQSEKGRATQRRYNQSEKGRALRRRYVQTEKGKRAVLKAARDRRARKVGCVGSHTAEEFVALCERYDSRCLACWAQFLLEELTEDHVIPIGPGVSDRIDNIQPLCGPCNSSKGARTVDYRLRT